MNSIKGFFEDKLGSASSSSDSTDTYIGKVPIHPLTQTPTKVWEKLKVKQVCSGRKITVDSSVTVTYRAMFTFRAFRIYNTCFTITFKI